MDVQLRVWEGGEGMCVLGAGVGWDGTDVHANQLSGEPNRVEQSETKNPLHEETTHRAAIIGVGAYIRPPAGLMMSYLPTKTCVRRTNTTYGKGGVGGGRREIAPPEAEASDGAISR